MYTKQLVLSSIYILCTFIYAYCSVDFRLQITKNKYQFKH